MSVSHTGGVVDRARPYLDAVAAVCEYYEVDVASKFVESAVVREATLQAGVDRRADSKPRIHYLTIGDGPPVLLLHGLGSTAAAWIPMLDALSQHFTVYAPDRPGRGLSAPVDYRTTGFREFGVAYVVEFLDALGVEETSVVGNSLGGFQTLALTADHPERVTGQCLVGAPAGLTRSLPFGVRLLCLPILGGWLFEYAKDESVADARDSIRQMNVVDDGALPDVYFKPGLVGEELPGQHGSLRSLIPTLMSVRGVRSEGIIRREAIETETPTRFVWGTEDAFWPPTIGESVAQEMAAGEVVVLERHGHMPWLEPNEAATDATLDFLRELTG